MRIYYPFRKGVLRFQNKEWYIFYPKKGASANRSGEGPLSQSQVRVVFQNYRMTGKPVVHKGGA